MNIKKENLTKKIYVRPIDEVKVEVPFDGTQIWLTQREMSLLYAVQILTIRKHLRNAYKKEKLLEERVTAKLIDSNAEGEGKTVYNLEAVINVGHRVNSELAVRFEKWLKERLEAEKESEGIK